ncbi:MAG: outer membrane protein assembly factor BamB family protein [Planctomycetota bacterium]|jgi:outer membrane protein assembly factor BamB
MRCKLFDFVILLAVVVIGTSSLHGGDWPMYRADASRTGYSSEPLPDNLELRWIYQSRTAPVPAWPDSSRITFDFAYQPIIVGNTVIFGSSAQDKVVAIDADSGKPKWTFFTGGPVRFAPAAWGDRIFVASDDGYLYAIKTDDGTVLWKHRGGLNERMCMGNERMISRWPARGGPVVADDIVYYAAGIWPSDGIFLYALDARTGTVLWTNDSTGRLYMSQPHGGANAHSGVTPQGYLLATNDRLFVPTGRAVPAAFRRSDGQFEYYRLQQNGSIGGARALIADRFVINAGCFLTKESGTLAARAGRGIFGALPDGILRSTGKKLLAYRWADIEKTDRKGKHIRYRGLEKYREIVLEDESNERLRAENVIKKMPALGDLYRTEVRFSEEYENVSKQTGLERTLTQARPDVEKLDYEVGPFQPTTYERRYEVIGAGREAVCGGPDIVRVVNLDNSSLRWSHKVEGNALGLAAGNGLLVASTSKGLIYCFEASKHSAPIIHKESLPAARSSKIDYAKAAKEILDSARIKSGICIDLGCSTGELALELVKQSQLYVIGIDSNPATVNRARRILDDADNYGSRVSIHYGDPRKTPYPRSCANLIVSTRTLFDKGGNLNKAEIERLQRPYGGVVCLGTPGQLQVLRRGPMKGAGQWTHQNCDAANTICSPDKVAKGPLEMAWYRDGVMEIADRHAQAPAPLCNRGYLVVEGVDGICAVDAYNGHTLWTYLIPGILADWDGVHHDVGVGDTGSNFCLSDDAVFVRIGERCLKIELATGRKINEFKTPVNTSDQDCNWGYIAYADGLLFGSVLNNEHTISPRYEGICLRNESVLLFALEADTGRLKWKYQPQHSVRNNTIAIAGGRVYLIDRPIALADRITDPKSNRKHRPLLKSGEHPGGTLIAMDARTGSVLWRNEHDVFGTQVAVSDKYNILLMYYQAVKHNFFKLPSEIGGRMAAFDVKTGRRLWDNKVEHKSRPLINEDVIYAEGGAWKLKTGEPVPWNFKRSYGCGQIAGSTNMLVFRSATLGYLDLRRNVGTENFGGIRPNCWFNAIVGGGLVLVPDGSSKCACSYQMRSWVALQQKQ